MGRILLLSCLLLLGACTIPPGQWEWRHDDPQYAESHRAEDIYECEKHAIEEASDGPRFRISNARPYGGWGNFDFEFCMQQRGWHLEYVTR